MWLYGFVLGGVSHEELLTVFLVVFSIRNSMNNAQLDIFKAINALASIDDFNALYKNSHFRYGFLNYVAKYGLASSDYYVSEKALTHLLSMGFVGADGSLRRGLKNQKNGFTYEHPIPANVVGKQLLESSKSDSDIERILKYSESIVILTSEEDALLRKAGYSSSMPKNWSFFDSSPYQRYFCAGIMARPPVLTLAMKGAIIR